MARKKTNITDKTRTVTLLNGKEYTVRYGMPAYDAMYALTGISLLKGWDETKQWDAREYVMFLYAGLLQYQHDITPDACYELIDGSNFAQVVDVLFDAYRAGLPAPKDSKENPTKPVATK